MRGDGPQSPHAHPQPASPLPPSSTQRVPRLRAQEPGQQWVCGAVCAERARPAGAVRHAAAGEGRRDGLSDGEGRPICSCTWWGSCSTAPTTSTPCASLCAVAEDASKRRPPPAPAPRPLGYACSTATRTSPVARGGVGAAGLALAPTAASSASHCASARRSARLLYCRHGGTAGTSDANGGSRGEITWASVTTGPRPDAPPAPLTFPFRQIWRSHAAILAVPARF